MNALLILSAYLGRAGGQLAVLWAFAHESGAEGAGDFAFAIAISTPVFVLFDLALRNVYQTLEAAPPFKIFLVIRITSAIAASAVLFGLGVIAAQEVSLRILLPLIVMKFSDTVLDLCFARMQAMRRVNTVALLNWVNTVLTLVLVFSSAALGLGAEIALTGSAAASLLVLALTIPQIGSEPVDSNRQSRWFDVRVILRAGGTLGLAQTLTSLLAYVPTFYLAASGDREAMGVFAACQYVVTLTMLFCNSIVQTWLGDLRRTFDAFGVVALNRRVRRIGAIMLSIGLTSAAATLVLLVPTLPLIFGDEFRVDMAIATPFALAVLAFSLEGTMTAFLLVVNKYGSRLTSAFGATVTTIIFAVVTSPYVSVALAGYVLLIGATTRCLVSAVTWFRTQSSLELAQTEVR